MDVALPLDKMTVSDKLRVMEEVWEDLCRTPGAVPAPDWHGEVLSDREKRVQDGSSRFEDWSEARRRIRERTK